MLRLSCTSYSHCKRWQVIILLHWAEAIMNHRFYFTAWGHIFLHYTKHEYKFLRSFLSYSSSFFSPYICLPTFFLPSPLNVLSSFDPYASKTKIRLWTHLVHLAILFLMVAYHVSWDMLHCCTLMLHCLSGWIMSAGVWTAFHHGGDIIECSRNGPHGPHDNTPTPLPEDQCSGWDNTVAT